MKKMSIANRDQSADGENSDSDFEDDPKHKVQKEISKPVEEDTESSSFGEYRCNLKGLYDLINGIRDKINEHHLYLFRGTPFGSFFMLFYEKRFDRDSIVTKTTSSIISVIVTYSYELGRIRSHRSKPTKVTGCLLQLLYWVCEHTSVIQPLQIDAITYPRVARWNLTEMTKAISKEMLLNLPNNKLIGEATIEDNEGGELYRLRVAIGKLEFEKHVLLEQLILTQTENMELKKKLKESENDLSIREDMDKVLLGDDLIEKEKIRLSKRATKRQHTDNVYSGLESKKSRTEYGKGKGIIDADHYETPVLDISKEKLKDVCKSPLWREEVEKNGLLKSLCFGAFGYPSCVHGVSSYRAYSTFFGKKGDGSVVKALNVSSSATSGSDGVDSLKKVWGTIVDAADYTGQKAKEALDVISPHVQHMLAANPYLKNVVMHVGLVGYAEGFEEIS
ncbi:hypothetical protein IFM89_033606 [Coptis chinensis]|uniref:Uncharacterized protein n=1 Tax=Coptis chinensis TaxID=261450 RepID=A0A835M099_9MAGN|nr:hypothetical protein IFM89_033606 [Coptis chinensis]